MEEGRKEGGGVREGGKEERRKEICSLGLIPVSPKDECCGFIR